MINNSAERIKLFEIFLWIFFLWYYMPIMRGFFYSGTYNLHFFTFYVCGIGLLLLRVIIQKKKIIIKFNVLFPVIIYFLFFSVLCFLDIGDAQRHIRVSFMFWGTLIVYYLTADYPCQRKRLVIFALIMLVVTFITSMYGVIMDPSAARTLTFAANDIAEDLLLRIKNIGDIYFFQCTVIMVPIFITFILKNYKRKFCFIVLVLSLYALISASFTISLILYFVAIVLSYISNKRFTSKVMIISALLVIILVIPWEDILFFLSSNIKNEWISNRLQSVAISDEQGGNVGLLGNRVNLYASSLHTFANNVFGIGPEYSYRMYDNGIGYHSQILDDLARYGIAAIIFYGCFFRSYYVLLVKQWKQINMEEVAMPIIIIYICFLFLNPGFTSAYESVMMFLIIPLLPELILDNRKEPNVRK